MFSIADETFGAARAEHVAKIGPLPLGTANRYTAWYMEATFKPEMTSAVHRRSGPGGWYVLSGEQGLETPNGKTVLRAEQDRARAGRLPHGAPRNRCE